MTKSLKYGKERGIRKRHALSGSQARSRAFAALGLLAASLVLLGGVILAEPPADQKEIEPPFAGMRWGEPSGIVEALLKGARANIVEKRPIDGGEIWTVEGLIQTSLRRTLFHFHDNMLIEVELQYQNADWDDAKYNDFMAQIRQRITTKYGEGQLIARSKTPQDGNVMQTVVGYKWSENNTALQLFYFSAENATEIYRTVSIHYKAY